MYSGNSSSGAAAWSRCQVAAQTLGAACGGALSPRDKAVSDIIQAAREDPVALGAQLSAARLRVA